MATGEVNPFLGEEAAAASTGVSRPVAPRTGSAAGTSEVNPFLAEAAAAASTGSAAGTGASTLSDAVLSSINTIKDTITTELNNKTRREKAEILKGVLSQLDAGPFIDGMKKAAKSTTLGFGREKQIKLYVADPKTTNDVFSGGKRKSRKVSRKAQRKSRKASRKVQRK